MNLIIFIVHAMRAAAKVRSQNTSTADTVTSMNTVNAAVVATVAQHAIHTTEQPGRRRLGRR